MRWALAAVLVLIAGAASAHGPAQWIQDGNYKNSAGDLCCGERDCAELADGDVVAIPGGYFIKSLSESVPASQATPSPDGKFWRCFWNGQRKCFFAPPQGSQIMLTPERLRAALSYDQATGDFRWVQSGSGRAVGSIAGSKNADGYIVIRIDISRYQAHRLAWLYVNNEWPSQLLDHINGIRHDNRIVNLRSCSKAENNRNRRPIASKRCPFKGVRVNSSGKYEARIYKDGRRTQLGCFPTAEEASAAYQAKAAEMFGKFAPAQGA